MGRRGPPPQPTKLRLLRGNPGRRRIGQREPRPPVETPICPRWLSKRAKEIWTESVPHLRAMQVLARVDRDALAAYCETYATWREAQEFLDAHGLVFPVRDPQGNIRGMQAYPQVYIVRSSLQMVRAYQTEFGMTPSARTRVRENPKLPEDPVDRRFFGPH